MPRTARSAALAALAALAAVAAILAADLTPPAAAQSEDETTGRIVARLLEDGRVEFGWQPADGERVLPRQRYFPPDATIDRWLRSSPVGVGGVELGRINARLLSDGRIEFAFTPTDGERIEPPARYFPADARENRWLRSTEIAIGPPEDATPGFTAISAGGLHTCAIRTNGEIACWGWNEYGQTDAPDGSFRAVSTGHWHTCGLRETGAIECWGKNDDVTGDYIVGQSDAPDSAFRAVSTGGYHACAIRSDDGAIECWGDNRGWIREPNATASRFTAVSAGHSHTCAIRSDDGAIECWGFIGYETGASDGYGQIDTPEGRFTAIDAGATHTCGLRSSGEIECWVIIGGWSGGHAGKSTAPEGSYTAVSGGGEHTCALRANGEIACWGYNRWGESSGAPEGSYTAVSAGTHHTCGLRENGAIECWGWNDNGQATPPTD